VELCEIPTEGTTQCVVNRVTFRVDVEHQRVIAMLFLIPEELKGCVVLSMTDWRCDPTGASGKWAGWMRQGRYADSEWIGKTLRGRSDIGGEWSLGHLRYLWGN
jgi:hypothetical protein